MNCSKCRHLECQAQSEDNSLCVFCEDGEPCPIAQRLQHQHGPIPTSGAKAMDNNVVRTCGIQGCDKALRATNASGYCTQHFYLGTKKPGTKQQKVIKAKPAKEAAPVKEPPNVVVVSERELYINKFLLGLPLSERANLVNHFLCHV